MIPVNVYDIIDHNMATSSTKSVTLSRKQILSTYKDL